MSAPAGLATKSVAARLMQGAVLLAAVTVISGCAHPLAISPDITKIEPARNVQPIDRNVGYYIAAATRESAVTTPGGGGDSVTYHPYRDIEAAFYKMLDNVFGNVTLLQSPNDAEAIARHSINYIVTPVIKADSSSPSPFTWPPTTFTFNLTCNITDSAGNPVGKPSVTGAGQAEFSEFKSDVSLSGKRATQDALLKMQDLMLQLPELRSR
jgi:hypothetical protein